MELTLLDGGMGRELKRIGAPFSQPLWSAQALIEAPDRVVEAHRNFLDAGARVITVNSYACVPFHLGEERYQEQGIALATQAARLAARSISEWQADQTGEASSSRAQVAGCLPPVMGSYRPDLFDANRARSLLTDLYRAQEPFVDLWLAETLSSLEEIAVVQEVLANSDAPRWFALTLQDDITDVARLRSGESVAEAVTQLCQGGADAILFNCSIPEVIEQALIDASDAMRRLRCSLPLGAYANSFAPIAAAHQANAILTQDRQITPQGYLDYATRWFERGARLIGGCCGISPSHIAALETWRRSM
ncbi:homocysteine S-methyltransferase family protein [Halomonas sp. DP5Y7-2]|uniref:homocysteine S-methyltransferase family protein n=1 Tax=Halomonas sp. DP5Y7-2 TaxID=2859076 RepID=UPI001C99A5ED|nr:homocysteine S-methyltransferase family protein [Halomonas sp. DP5Y7-2]MBY5985145.1 homocysteine S-methyltransferase family protein [Halomonas sp. DP5Y7-2]